MTDDQTFQLILAIGLTGILPVSIYHRIGSQASREKLDRRQEGLFILMTLRPIGLAGMCGLLTFVVNPAWMTWSSVPLPLWVRWSGVGIGVAAGLLLIWTFRTLGTNLTDTVVTRRHHRLVTTGPYQFVRHPFYIAAALAITANTLAAANLFIGLTGWTAVLLLIFRTTIEEEHLVRRFGENYTRYMKDTGRFFPRLSSTSPPQE